MSIVLWGQYPRSESLVQATRDWDRERLDEASLTAAQEKDRRELLRLQEGFPYHSTGQLHWEDLIRPLTQLSSGYSSGALTRFFETNTFWRTITGQGPLDTAKIPHWIDTYFPHLIPTKTLYSFPSPILFEQLSSGPSLKDFLPLFSSLPPGLLVFVEPALGKRTISRDQRERAHSFLEQLKQQIQFPIALVTTLQEIGTELDYIYSLPVDGIGIDFYRNCLADVLPTFPSDKFLIAGLLDTESALLEEKEGILAFKRHAEDWIAKDKIYYSHSGPAELLPKEVMDAKVRHLKEVLK